MSYALLLTSPARRVVSSGGAIDASMCAAHASSSEVTFSEVYHGYLNC